MGCWRTLTVDLEAPLADVAMGGADRLHITAFAGSRPLGSVLVPAPIDPFPAPLLADALVEHFAEAWHGAVLEDRLSPPAAAPAEGLRTAVLVCSRDRPESLARCLRSIGSLTARVDEVIVVDNASSVPGTRAVVEAAGARYVHEPVPGLDRARNRGFAVTTADVVLCTDDDVEVDPDWASRLLDCFADPLVMAATGLVLPARLDTEARQLFEEHAGFSRGVRRRVFDGAETSAASAGAAGAGASMALRTDAVRRAGGFPEQLDAGTPTASGGDTAMVYEVLRQGFRVVYEPRAVAFHHHRDDPVELTRVLRGYGTGLYAFFTHGIARHGDLDLLLAATRWTATRLVRETARSLLHRPGAAPAALALAELRGSLAGPLAYRRATRRIEDRPNVALPSHRPEDGRWWGCPATPATDMPATDKPTDEMDAATLPSVSIVIPSRGRRSSLLRLLGHLRTQSQTAEVVVVLDGDLDGSAAALAALPDLARPVLVTLDPPSPAQGLGAALARNAGAAAASGEVLLFLDDDVVPVDDLLVHHHATLHARAGRPVLGVGPCPPSQLWVDDRFAMAVRNWWVDHHGRLLRDEPGLTFTDVATANLSVPRTCFADLGGFLPVARREDWELGYRAVGAGIDIRAVPAAIALHEADVDLASALEDRHSEGQGDVAFARAHPGVARRLPLGDWARLGRRRRRLVASLFDRPERFRFVLRAAPPVLGMLAARGFVSRWSRIRTDLAFVSYWSGVAAAAGTADVLDTLLAPEVGRTAVRTDQAVVFDLEAPTAWQPPPAAGNGDGDVLVVAGGEALGWAPLGWGGFPWARERFSTAVRWAFADHALRAEARAVAP